MTPVKGKSSPCNVENGLEMDSSVSRKSRKPARCVASNGSRLRQIGLPLSSSFDSRSQAASSHVSCLQSRVDLVL